MLIASILVGMLAAADDLAARMAVLEKHLEGLNAVSVAAAFEAEKETKLHDLAEMLAQGAQKPEEVNGFYLKMDEVRWWLWEHAAERPSVAEGAFTERDDAWVVANPHLTLSMKKEDFVITVTTPTAAWAFGASDDQDIELAGGALKLSDARHALAEGFRTGYSVGMLITLRAYPGFPEQEFVLGIHLIKNEVRFSIVAPHDLLEFKTIQWPKPITLGNAPTDLSVIPFMQGMLLPGDFRQRIRQRDQTNSRTLYMPWWAQIRDGHGALTILETSDDAGVAYDHDGRSPTVIRPLWHSSFRTVGYQRWARYIFEDEATYVTMARRYRRYVQETGRFVTLEEKRRRTPNLNKVIGRPVVHIGALYHNVEQSHYYNKERLETNHALVPFEEIAAQLRSLKAKGVDAYVHLDGWGFYGYDNGHPDPLPPGAEQGGWDGLRALADTCDELGWIFATHDQYRDFYFTAASFDDRLTLLREDGARDEHSTWCGGPQTILSALWAPGYVRRNHDLFAEHGIKVRGAYLDVFAIVPLEESYHPAHPMTRSQCAAYRKECFDLLRARGYVVSSEEPVNRFVPDLDLVHHGPYSNAGSRGFVGIPAPLFSLVYHDAILLPWSMNEDGGGGIPKGDAGWLHCLLNAGLPYVSPGDTGEALERVRIAAELARRCGTREMVNHEFLDEAHRRQRTTFSDGTQVTVDFETKEYTIVPGKAPQ